MHHPHIESQLEPTYDSCPYLVIDLPPLRDKADMQFSVLLKDLHYVEQIRAGLARASPRGGQAVLGAEVPLSPDAAYVRRRRVLIAPGLTLGRKDPSLLPGGNSCAVS